MKGSPTCHAPTHQSSVHARSRSSAKADRPSKPQQKSSFTCSIALYRLAPDRTPGHGVKTKCPDHKFKSRILGCLVPNAARCELCYWESGVDNGPTVGQRTPNLTLRDPGCQGNQGLSREPSTARWRWAHPSESALLAPAVLREMIGTVELARTGSALQEWPGLDFRPFDASLILIFTTGEVGPGRGPCSTSPVFSR